MQLIGFDFVEVSNIASQGYWESDMGEKKVDATAALCLKINPELKIETIDSKFTKKLAVGKHVFVCVDSITDRKVIYRALKHDVSFFVDGRMTAEALRVVTFYDNQTCEAYNGTLFSAEDAYQGPCTARSTMYCANIAGGFMVAQFTKYLRCTDRKFDSA